MVSDIRLSKSQLDKFVACPRCFWMEKHHRIKQPEGIRAGVPMGIDRVLKGHYDAHRAAKKVPNELVGKIPSGLYPGDRIHMEDLRNWRKGLVAVVDGVELSTAMDDLLFDPATGIYNVYDAKSKAKLTNEEDTARYYQTQADAYDLAHNENSYKTDGRCFFGYYSPVDIAGNLIGEDTPDGRMVAFNWHCQVITIRANHDRIKTLIRAAAACIEGPLPEPNVNIVIGKRGGTKVEGCAVCAYVLDYAKTIEAMREVA